jgi:hypothetical protein
VHALCLGRTGGPRAPGAAVVLALLEAAVALVLVVHKAGRGVCVRHRVAAGILWPRTGRRYCRSRQGCPHAREQAAGSCMSLRGRVTEVMQCACAWFAGQGRQAACLLASQWLHSHSSCHAPCTSRVGCMWFETAKCRALTCCLRCWLHELGSQQHHKGVQHRRQAAGASTGINDKILGSREALHLRQLWLAHIRQLCTLAVGHAPPQINLWARRVRCST